MSAPPSEPLTSSGSSGSVNTPGAGAFEALSWGIRRLVGSPALLAFVAITGAGLGLTQPGEFSLRLLAVGVANLFVTAITYRHAGMAFDDVADTRDLVKGAVWAVPRLIGAWIWFIVGLVVLVFLIRLAGVLGILLALPAIFLFLIHTILVFPAVCIDRGLFNGLFAGWDYARNARLTLFGLLLVTGIPLMILETQLTGSDPVVIAGFGTLYGCVFAASNLAFARIYVSQRSLQD